MYGMPTGQKGLTDMATKTDHTRLTDTLKKAFIDAARERERRIALRDGDDFEGGTCNLDSPIVVVDRANKKVEEAIKAAGCVCWYNKRSYNRGYVIAVGFGQAEFRTAAAEFISRALKDAGFRSTVWYQAD